MTNRSTPLLYTRWRACALALCTAAALWLGAGCSRQSELVDSRVGAVSTTAITQGADEMRTSWYGDQPQLAPATVSGFKQIFNTTLVASQMQSAADKVLAQPLVVGNNVLVVTEANNLYLVDGTSGAVVANRTLAGGAFDASAAFGCGDISPTVGITGTPVIDRATNIAYFYSKNAAGDYSLHAINANDLSERPGFPVVITGNAQNDPTATFTSRLQLQRPALLLMNGVIYAAFGAHCDAGAYRGWVIGVSTAGAITARFTTEVGTANAGNGNGIWMSGGGLASDGAGRIFFTTGNGAGADPGPLASNAPPGNLVESVVRVDVQADGSLKAMDFFAPHEAFTMGDSDLSGGAAVLLPSQFGSAANPNTAVAVGKEGILYLMDRSKLGGYKQGAGQTDAVLSEISVNGSLRSHAAVWPGDGGYVYVAVTGGDANNVGFRLRAFKYAPNAQGVPALSLVGVAGVGTGNGDDFGQYSGSPIVTSDGLTSGSAVVWITSNTGALRAYNAVPVNGVMNRLIEIGFNDQAKFTKPAVGNGAVYVGTDNGRLVGFAAAASPIAATPLNFGTVTTGQTKTLNAVVSAPTGKTITVSALSSSNNALFTLGTSTPALPVTLTGAQMLTVPVTFKPTAATAYSGLVNVTTDTGLGTVSLTGTGQTLAPQLSATPTSLDFGGVPPNGTTTANVILTNTGSQTLTFSGSTAPAAPFSVTSPAIVNGQTLATGAQTTVSLKFAPTALGTSTANLVVNSNGGNLTIPLTGLCASPATMVITPLSLNFGSIPANTSKALSFTIQNTGGLALIIQKSKPPVASQFTAQTTLAEGSTIAAGQTATETVTLSAATAGTYNDVWTITGSDSSGLQQVAFTGTVTPASAVLSRTGWQASASLTGGNDVAGNAIDAAGGATRFSTGVPQSSTTTQTITLDMLTAQTINQITMDSGGDYARSYQVFASNDVNNFGTAITSGNGTANPLTITFPQVTARYLRVAQLPTAGQGAWWSIYDFNVYGFSGGGGGGGTGGAGGSGGSGGASGGSGGTGGASGGTGGASGGSGGTSGGTGDGSALARTGWTGTASATAGGDITGNALDADVNTRWSSGIAQNAASTQSYVLDMQSAQTFAKLTLTSGGDYARTYQVFAGNSATTFGAAIASGTGTAALTTITFPTQTARYIKITQATNAATTAWWSISDLMVFQPGGVTALDRTGWIAGGSATGDPPGNALDGVLNSRWSTGASQVNGQYFTVDMLTAKTFKQLTLDANGGADYPRGYQVFVSADGVNWGTAIASGSPTTPLVTIGFAAQTARFIKVVQTATLASNWWSLYELNVYN